MLQGTFLLETLQVLLISTVRSLVPQKYISDFRGIKHYVVVTNSYQFVGSINFEDNSTTTGHYVAYLKCSTGVIKINDSDTQHHSESILQSK